MKPDNMTKGAAALELSTATAQSLVKIGEAVQSLADTVARQGRELEALKAQPAPGTQSLDVTKPAGSEPFAGW